MCVIVTKTFLYKAILWTLNSIPVHPMLVILAINSSDDVICINMSFIQATFCNYLIYLI